MLPNKFSLAPPFRVVCLARLITGDSIRITLAFGQVVIDPCTMDYPSENASHSGEGGMLGPANQVGRAGICVSLSPPSAKGGGITLAQQLRCLGLPSLTVHREQP